MLRVIQNRDSHSAKGYYTSSAEAGYYLGARQELVGSWGGLAAERLGLYGDVSQPDFDRLIDNRHPETGERLTARMRKDRTPGYDFSFHACKSASLLYALTGDPAILDAFRKAVAETMAEVEQRIQTRVRKGGRYEDRTVGNMAWAEFIHFTARPVKGVIDPHLHAHCFVINAVFDPIEHRWKAGQFRELKASAPQFEKAFHGRFAWKLAALGYPIERTAKGWEVGGIERDTIEKFSARTRQIEAYARMHGITEPKEKDRIGARIRERKRSDTGMDELRDEWQTRLTDRERIGMAAASVKRGFTTGDGRFGSLSREEWDAATARDAIRHVHAPELPPGLAERQSVEAKRRFLAREQERQRLQAAEPPSIVRPRPQPRQERHGR